MSAADIKKALQATKGDVPAAVKILAQAKYPTEQSDDVHYVDYVHQGKPNQMADMTKAEIEKMMTERKEHINLFYIANRDSITTVKDYPINGEKLTLWRDRIREGHERVSTQENELKDYEIKVGYDGNLSQRLDYKQWEDVEDLGSQDALTLSALFAKYARYVSYDAFVGELGRLVQIVQGYRMGEGGIPKRKIALFMHQNLGRSSTWVALLMWPRLVRHVDALVASFAEIHELAKKDGWGNMLVVVVDDAAYTGKQIYQTITEYHIKFEEDFSEDGLLFFIAIPFMSQQAVDRNTAFNASFTMVPNNTGSDQMKTMQELLEQDDPTALDLFPSSEFFSEFRLDHTPVYFAHKLADLVSVPNHLFALAPYLEIDDESETITIKRMTLIDQCSPENYKYDVGDDEWDWDEWDNDFLQDEGEVCPFPPYKSARYTWREKDVPKDQHIIIALDYLINTSLAMETTIMLAEPKEDMVQFMEGVKPQFFVLTLKGSNMFLIHFDKGAIKRDYYRNVLAFTSSPENARFTFVDSIDDYMTAYKDPHLLALVSVQNGVFLLNGFLLGTFDHKDINPAHGLANFDGLQESAKIAFLSAQKPPPFYSKEFFSVKEVYYFGTMLVRIFEYMALEQDKKHLLLESLPNVGGFYEKLGFRKFGYGLIFVKEPAVPLDSPQWHNVMKERKKMAQALLLSQGNLVAAAQLVWYRFY
jgi:hypothetical protein